MQLPVGSPVAVAPTVVPVKVGPQASGVALAHRSLAGPVDTTKLVAEVAVPLAFTTAMAPVVAPAGTVAVSWVLEFAANVGALVPLKLTCVKVDRFVPVMTTLVPTGPEVGVKLVMVGAADVVVAVNDVAEVAVPAGATTEIAPVVVPAATVAVSCVAEFTAKLLAVVPLKRTAVAPVKFAPCTVTTVPTGPLAGAKLVIVVTAVDDGLMVKLVSEISKK